MLKVQDFLKLRNSAVDRFELLNKLYILPVDSLEYRE